MQNISDRLLSIVRDISTAGYSDAALNITASHVSGLTTGFKNIDSLTGGFQRGEVILIAAPPLMWMTPFAISLANKVLQQGLGIVYFSTFLSEDQIIKKLLSNYFRISTKNLLRGNINEELDPIDQYPVKQLYVDDTPELTAEIIREKLDSLIDNPGYVIIDNLNLFERHLNISTTDKVLRIKGIARMYNIPVIVLYDTKAISFEPALTQDQFVEIQQQEIFSELNKQLVDTLCMIYHPEYFKIVEDERGQLTLGRADFIIVKNDCGEGIATFNFKHEFSLFQEIN